MKKTITAMAVAAALTAPMMASADATVYGKMNAAITQTEAFGADAAWSMDVSEKKGSALGVKGSAETNLADVSAVYKYEIGFKNDNKTIYQRDTWVGLSSKSMGTVRAGIIKTAYKASGGYVDAFWDTAAQGRGDLGIMSDLHNGTGDGKGRQTNNLQYTSPSIAGANIIVDYNMAENKKDNLGVGVHYKSGPVLAFLDYVSQPEAGADGSDLTATKLGGKYTAGDIAVALQYEIDGGAVTGADNGGTDKSEGNVLFTNVTYSMGATALSLSYGMKDESSSNAGDDRTGFAVGAIHSIAKTTALYAAYGSLSGGDAVGTATDHDATIMSFGMQHSF